MIFIEINFDDITKYSLIIIDIRDNSSYKIKHLKKAINIPFTNLLINPSKYLDKNKTYLLVCEYGIKSKKTSEILNRQGFHTFSLKNGLKGLT